MFRYSIKIKKAKEVDFIDSFDDVVFDSIEEFDSYISDDSREIIEGNRGIKTKDLISLIEAVGINHMAFSGGCEEDGKITHVDTIYVKKTRLGLATTSFTGRYGVDESGDYADGYWRFWWD